MNLDKEIYQYEYKDILENLNVNKETGLSEKEAKQRLNEYGLNSLKQKSQISPWKIFVSQLKNIIVILLIIASSISFFIGDTIEGIAIFIVIILNALFGFITEYRAEKSVEELKKMVSTKAKVLRDGNIKEIDSENVVPGDIMIIEEGDRITADGRLIEADNLAVDESALTGESDAVNKNTKIIEDKDIPLADTTNMVYMGTAVTRGNGIVIITGTSSNTEMGEISDLLSETKDEKTPLEVKLDQLGKSLVGITLVIAAIISLIGIISGNEISDMLKTGIALAIAAVPEGLPAVATITLAIGMRRMAKHNALVKSLPAVETLGSTTVICTDKTGTLTENQMTVQKIFLPNRYIDVSGTGYNPEGEFKENNKKINIDNDQILELFIKSSIFSSNAVINKEDDLWKVVGDPTEGALITAGKKAGINKKEMGNEKYTRIDEIPFTSEDKYMATSYNTPEGNFIYLKGAPNVVLDLCDQYQNNEEINKLDKDNKSKFLEVNNKLAKEGLRVLAIAYKKQKESNIKEEIKNDLVFIGFAGIMDPPRPDVKNSINLAKKAGIRTIMITGDQADTAYAIGQMVGIGEKSIEPINGSQLKKFNLSELKEKIKTNSIFARVSPRDKLNIIDALNENNEVTAMTGDGVNDAPALKKADIGVSMGQRGTAVAKEASDMVLLDDKFSTIVEAIKQGRVIFDNIQKFIHYLFSCNLSEIIFIFIGILLQLPTPLLALQILWLNLVTDVFPALVMAWETPEDNIMNNPPRDPDMEILTNTFKKKIGLQALIITMGPLFTYIYALNYFDVAQSRTIGFMALAFVQLFHVFNVRRKNGLGFDHTLKENKYLWGAIILTISLQLLAVYTPFLQRVIYTVSLSLNMWYLVLMGSLGPVIAIQIYSYIKNYMKKTKNN